MADAGARPAALQGADRVNDDLEVGFDSAFEHRWHHAEVAGRCVMLAVVVAGLAGLLGRGPYSHHTMIDRSGRLAIDFEPVARYDTATQITFHLRRPPAAGERLTLGSSFAEPGGFQSVMPQPLSQHADADRIVLDMGTAPAGADMAVRVLVKPTAIGPIDFAVHTPDGLSLRWRQFVLP